MNGTTRWSLLIFVVNMLYLDQPAQVGFSYDTLTNVTRNLVADENTILNATDPIPEQNATLLVGTYASQDGNRTAFGTVNAAIAAWHFLQAWVQEFPEYMPNDNRISLATESYGGRYGPKFFSFFQEQNERITNGTWDEKGESAILHLDTLMLINSCIDRLVQWPSYPHIAYNNTYGIKTVNASVHEQMLDALYRKGGCNDHIYKCRNLSLAFDPENIGINDTVNDACKSAETFCTENLRSPFFDYSGRSYYDFATLIPDPFTTKFYQGFLNQPHVQADLGVPLNCKSHTHPAHTRDRKMSKNAFGYTWVCPCIIAANTPHTVSQSSPALERAFRTMGDYNRPGWLEDLAYLLESGVKVTMAYGDRDFACVSVQKHLLCLLAKYARRIGSAAKQSPSPSTTPIVRTSARPAILRYRPTIPTLVARSVSMGT